MMEGTLKLDTKLRCLGIPPLLFFKVLKQDIHEIIVDNWDLEEVKKVEFKTTRKCKQCSEPTKSDFFSFVWGGMGYPG